MTISGILCGRYPLAALVLLTLLPVTACGSAGLDEAKEDGAIRVVATTGMVGDITRSVGGKRVHVDQLMGPGVDPHLYRATEGDVTSLTRAEIIFYNGLHLEARMADVLERTGGNRLTVAVADSIPEERRLFSAQFGTLPDPHVWMDVSLWMLAVEAIRDNLVEFDPAGAAEYKANAEQLLSELSELHDFIIDETVTIPEGQRVLVTAHDAFSYFGEAYNLEVIAPQGISTESEAGIGDIRTVISAVVERNIPAIFVESSVPPDVIEAIIEGARSRGHEVKIGGQLFSDALGDSGTPEGTYMGMIRHNVMTITAGLKGE